ncbi:hypothetical protein A9G41_02625 [Gilliamella sp. Nev5-1]|nr:hypothetical protein A9G40_10600 [Gilliamella apicola]OCG71604.1 hypothetical protein A9G41_02625 [Gilliamella apicola]
MLPPAPFVKFARPTWESNEADSMRPPALPGIWREEFDNINFTNWAWDDEVFKGGFFVRSVDPSSYNLNFPRTGMDGLYFYLDIAGVDPSTLNWPPVTHGGITATVSFVPPYSRDNYNLNAWEFLGGIKVKLRGPAATKDQVLSSAPASVTLPTLPQTFEIVGYDSDGKAVIKYGFELQKWFVFRKCYGYDGCYMTVDGNRVALGQKEHADWCDSIGYRVPAIEELTNAQCEDNPWGYDPWYHANFPCNLGIDSATPHSPNEFAQRNIGPFISEWGYLRFAGCGSRCNDEYVWTSDSLTTTRGRRFYFVVAPEGNVTYGRSFENDSWVTALCVNP